MFEKHKTKDVIDLDTNLLFNFNSKFKWMKPLVKEFFRIVQGLTKTKLGKAAFYISM